MPGLESEKPSLAKQFYQSITGPESIRNLIGSSPPTYETEWLDFKGAARLRDDKIKEIWSEALSGFSNTQGGVLIWGVDARPDSTTGVDAASGLSLVENVSAFKSRLNTLQAGATDPPVLRVEIKEYPAGAGSDEGFVVCYIPESPYRPHRAESSNRQYVIRAGAHFVTASVSLLRNLFFPQTRCLLVPTVKAFRHVENDYERYVFDAWFKNHGTATAFDAFVIVHYAPFGGLTSRLEKDWETGPELSPYHAHATPLHPGIETRFCHLMYGQPQANHFELRVQVYAQNAEPVEWHFHFQESEVIAGTSKGTDRKSLWL
jgi:hypothetical protein